MFFARRCRSKWSRAQPLLVLLPAAALALVSASGQAQSPSPTPASQPADRLHFKGAPASATVPTPGHSSAPPTLTAFIVHAYPHDPHAFTQGLEFLDGHLYESTGRRGQSTLRETTVETGAVIRQITIPPQYFGEGLTVFHNKIYQLTWLSKLGFVYDLRTFRKTGEFHYESEGWGLTHDDSSLILSDGSNKLQFLDPASFKITKTLEVYAGNEAVTNLNELEYIKGELWANVWHQDRIARIDPHSGQVTAWMDLSSLAARGTHEQEDVLNGIAYDAKHDRIFVTGKNWSELFEIKINSSPN